MRRGLYRIHGTGDLPDEVRVDDDGIEMPMAEQAYCDRKYLPRLADLPWQEDYVKKPIDDLSDQQPARIRVGSGQTLSDIASWGSRGAVPGRSGGGAAFRERLGPVKK